jgi:hypothetical protein
MQVVFLVKNPEQFNLSPFTATLAKNVPATPLQSALAHHSEKSATYNSFTIRTYEMPLDLTPLFLTLTQKPTFPFSS